MLTLRFTLTVFFLILLNVAFGMQFILFSFIPDPLEDMFNSSYYKHYGHYIDSFGISTIWSVSTFLQKGGDLIGLLFLLQLVDTKGRKFGAIWLRFWMILGCGSLLVLAYFLPSFETFTLAGLFNGAGIELKWCTVAIFLTEIAPDEYRGVALMLISFGDALGQLLFTVICRPSFFGNTENWFLLPAGSLLLAIIAIFYLGWVHESPKYLTMKKKYIKAEKSLVFYQGRRINTEEMIQVINIEILEGELDKNIGFRELWNDEALRKVTILLFCIFNATDISAASIEFLFFARIHTLHGLTPETVMTIGSITRIAIIPLFLISTVAIEKLGRRFLALGSLCAIYFKAILTMTGLLLSFYLGPSTITRLIAIFSDVLSSLAGVFGNIQVFSLLCCELTPSNVRVQVIQIISMVSMASGLVFNSLIPFAFNYFPPLPYIFLLIFQPFLIIHVYKNLPETKGREMYRIVEDFHEAVRSRASTRRTTLVKDEEMPLLAKKQLLQ